MRVLYFILLFLSVIGLPLIGVYLDGKPVHQYTHFPPLTQYVVHAPFSWIVVLFFLALFLVIMTPFFWKLFRFKNKIKPAARPVHAFPWWGWAGIFFCIIIWALSWTRFPWFKPFQAYTFSPLWFSYIIIVNAWTFKRTEQSLLTHRPVYFTILFFCSSVFWWVFEYLNRFAQNWYYTGIENFNTAEYILFATLAFSVVLPAIISANDLLRSFPELHRGLDNFLPIRIKRPKILAWLVLILSVAGLLFLGVFSDYLFPLVWTSLFSLIISYQVILKKETIFSKIKQGNWETLYFLALSALICGFFWEMWNIYSLAKWKYSVPFVDKFHVFEMPLLGYMGYLPFGLECGVISKMLEKIIKH